MSQSGISQQQPWPMSRLMVYVCCRAIKFKFFKLVEEGEGERKEGDSDSLFARFPSISCAKMCSVARKSVAERLSRLSLIKLHLDFKFMSKRGTCPFGHEPSANRISSFAPRTGPDSFRDHCHRDCQQISPTISCPRPSPPSSPLSRNYKTSQTL
ncbi:hypothetical protein C8F01DRAFT_131590 [Mycena amicta]|nr:hypothetical protein C8F01DRAFT_131590 [Mycena amicta]